MSVVCVTLAYGFEEIEAVSLIDILRRANINVIVAGVGLDNDKIIEGAHGLKMLVEKDINEVSSKELDFLVLPGGMPGAKNLSEDKTLQKLIKAMDNDNKYIGAICAAPYVLKTADVLKNKYTAYPGWDSNINHHGYIKDIKVVEDENILTSQGPGTAMCFALEIVKKLKGKTTYDKLKKDLLADFC